MPGGRKLDDVAAAILGVAAALEEGEPLELVEQADEGGWIEAKGGAPRAPSQRPVIAQDRKGEDVTRAQAGWLERNLRAAPGDSVQVVDEHEGLVGGLGDGGARCHRVHGIRGNRWSHANLCRSINPLSLTKDRSNAHLAPHRQLPAGRRFAQPRPLRALRAELAE